jgi:hypothetical protein
LLIEFGSGNKNCGLSTHVSEERHLGPPALHIVPYKE